MKCEECQQSMQAALDGELDAAAVALQQEHLHSCASCQSVHTDLLRVRAMVRSHASRHTAPAALRLRVVDDIAHAQVRESNWRRLFAQWKTWPWGRINFGFASTASLAFAVVFSLYLQVPTQSERLDQEIVATHYRSLQVDHLADVASSDQHTVKPWFSGKLDFSPAVVDLAAQGFPLIGGRLDYFDQHAAAGLAYRHGKHLINVFVWPDDSVRHHSDKIRSIHGFQLLRWSDDGMAYAAISDMNARELLQFQQLLALEIAK